MSHLRISLLLGGLIMTCTLLANGGDKPLKLPKHIKQNFVHIPAGEVLFDGEKSTVDEFYIYKQELTNIDFNEFLHDLKQSGQLDLLEIVMPDSNGWNIDDAYMEPYVKAYHNHPSYYEYPVVNISHEAAVKYCKWLTERLNENQDNEYIVEARLPRLEEWLRAARPTDAEATYSWGGPYLRNSKGEYLCNFYNTGLESISRNPETGELVVVQLAGQSTYNTLQYIGPAPAVSFQLSMSGAYNLNGNVAEMVAEDGIAMGGSWRSPGYDVRNESVQNYDAPSPEVGFRPVLIFRPKE